MSDTSPGPGWWVASDGKWYPPEQAPGAQPAPAQPPPPQPSPPPSQPPPPAAPKSSKGSTSRGCIYSLIALAVVVVVGGIGLVVALVFVVDQVGENVDEALQDKPCPFLTNEQAQSVFGDGVDTISLSGLNELLEITADNRVLADAPSCLVRNTSTSATVARVARYEGADGTTVYDRELETAGGVSEDRGGGLSVETDDYRSDQAVSVGDEGFCTSMSIMGASGALVRKGDVLVYVAVQPQVEASAETDNVEGPEFDVDAQGLFDDEANCSKGQELAEKVLG